MLKNSFIILSLSFLIFSCNSANDKEKIQSQVQGYLNRYNVEYQKLAYESNLGQWQLQTHIVEGDTISSNKAAAADEALAKFTGSKANVDTVKMFLDKKDLLTPLQLKELQIILLNAGNNPEAAGDVVKRRIAAQNKQVENLYGFKFMIDGKETTPNAIQEILNTSTDMTMRRKAWEASKEVGTVLKDGLDSLRDLRNKSVTPLGYADFFNYNSTIFGYNAEQLIDVTHGMIKDVWPLYRELHTWARYELAKKYKQPVPDYIPADWLPNRWGQDWTALVNVEGMNIDPVLKEKGAEWIPKEAEKFYMSIGFDSLPESFFEKSSLYPVAPDAGYKKNTHATAWHMDLDKDVRSLQSIEANTEWWSTCLHEFGHIYYYLSYSHDSIPYVLRDGASPAFHEGFGTMMGLASLQKPFLQGLGLIPADVKTNDTMLLLKEALDYIVHIPWGAGVMTEFEYNLYTKNLPENQFNAEWWDLVKRYQGIVPPSVRDEHYCDAATKTHINDNPSQYYKYSMSNLFLFQIHTFIADSILHQDPHATNYWGNKKVGDFLKSIMSPGETVDWKELLEKNIHSDLSAQPMVKYFEPLMAYLKKVNAGRTYTLPEQPDFAK
ncbi:MAG: M2 family metallopeptidase [Bacteroidota bacterium]